MGFASCCGASGKKSERNYKLLPLADDEDSWSLLSHWRKTLNDHIVHQSIFVFFLLLPPSFHLWARWSLLAKFVPRHRLRQLIGQLHHCHL